MQATFSFFVRFLGLSLVFLAAMTSQSFAQQRNWEGRWDTEYGPVALNQDGLRVWGDYVNARGVIEARIQPDGSLRGTFLRADQRWGFFEWQPEARQRGWRGVYAMNDIPRLDGSDQSWNAQRRSGFAGVLRFAVGERSFWPPTFPQGPTGLYAAFLEATRVEPTPPPAGQPGKWHVNFGYEGPPRPTKEERFAIWVGISHPPGLTRGRIHLSFQSPDSVGMAACPPDMHPALCRDIMAYFPVYSNEHMKNVRSLGLRLEPDQASYLFTLGSSPVLRLMTVTRAARPDRALLRIGSLDHGIELQMEIALEDAGCRFDECLKDFDLAPKLEFGGRLTDISFANLPDNRASAHVALRPSRPSPAPARSVPLAYSDSLTIRALNGEALGVLEIETLSSGQIGGRGELLSPRAGAGMMPVTATIVHLAPQALQIDLGFSTVSGLPPAMLLLDRAPAERNGALQGTLIIGPADRQNWMQVTLFPESPGPDDNALLDDAPGFGVHASRFVLRNSAGAAVGLRDRPRSDAPIGLALAANATDIWVIECTPAIDGFRWEQGDLTSRHRLLDRGWCQVFRDTNPQFTGWLPGHFLSPIGN